MSELRPSSKLEQVVSHLREGILTGRWSVQMPGRDRLSREIGVSPMTIVRALRILAERDNLLVARGSGRTSLIQACAGQNARRLRIGILAGETADLEVSYVVELRHALEEAGHSVFILSRFLLDPKMTPNRLDLIMNRTPADAWIAIAAPRETLEWLVARDKQLLAIFGRRRGLPIASVGPDKSFAMLEATRQLLRLGHRNIVLLNRRMRRFPTPGHLEKKFLAELLAHGIRPGSYHLPDWQETPDGLHRFLEKLFRLTPPTAMIIDEAPLYFGVQQFLATRGIHVPNQVSLFCNDASPDFAWCRPSVAHVHWDSRPIVRRALKWAANVALGKEDKTQTLTPANFVSGGTIGPCQKGKSTSFLTVRPEAGGRNSTC